MSIILRHYRSGPEVRLGLVFVFCLSRNVHHCQCGWKRHKRMMLYKLLNIEDSRKVYELFIIFQGKTTILSVPNIITFCSDRKELKTSQCLSVFVRIKCIRTLNLHLHVESTICHTAGAKYTLSCFIYQEENYLRHDQLLFALKMDMMLELWT